MREPPPAEPSRTTLRMATGVLACTAVAVLLVAVAIALYPGGTWMDRHTRGFDAWRNFICDLAWPIALDGRPNPVGAVLLPAAILCFSAALVQLWWVFPVLFPALHVLRRLVRGGGLLSSLAAVAVPFTPRLHVSRLHPVVLVLVVGPGAIAAAAAILGLWRGTRTDRLLALLGLATLGAGLGDGALYLATYGSGAVPTSVPALQRLATVLLLGWIVAVSVRVRHLGARRV